MRLTYQEYVLDEAAVDTISDDVQKYLKKLNTEKRAVQRIRLTVEELLLNILERCGSGMTISVGLGRQFGRHVFRMRYEAEPFDPSKGSENPVADDMMRSLGLFPAWSARGRTNTVSLILANRPKRNDLFYLSLAVLVAVILGTVGNVIPENYRLLMTESLLTPLSNGFLGLLNTFAGVMIFLTICNGILGTGDSATLGRLGKSVVARFIGLSFASSAAATVLVLPFLRLNFSVGGQGKASVFEQISRMFFDILPTNIIDPFKTGNTFHIIIIAAFFGCALLAIGEHGTHIRDLVNESAVLFQRIILVVCALSPLFVFSTLLELIWSGQAGVLLSVIKPIVLISAFILFFGAVIWLITSARLKCPPILLLKKVMPVFFVAFASASSVSAFPLGMETCERKLGVKKSLTSFVYPMGSVMYMPSSVIYFTVLVCTLSETYQIPVSVPWLIMAIVIATLITIAMPPIPGGDILCYSVLFSGLGIPAEAVMLATAIGFVLDYLDTGANVTLLLFRITCAAKQFDDLDRTVLLQKGKAKT